jgi:hypothetical protein
MVISVLIAKAQAQTLGVVVPVFRLTLTRGYPREFLLPPTGEGRCEGGETRSISTSEIHEQVVLALCCWHSRGLAWIVSTRALSYTHT